MTGLTTAGHHAVACTLHRHGRAKRTHLRGRKGMNQKGFTLIELLIVMLVISVLATITTIQRILHVRSQARSGAATPRNQ